MAGDGQPNPLQRIAVTTGSPSVNQFGAVGIKLVAMWRRANRAGVSRSQLTSICFGVAAGGHPTERTFRSRAIGRLCIATNVRRAMRGPKAAKTVLVPRILRRVIEDDVRHQYARPPRHSHGEPPRQRCARRRRPRRCRSPGDRRGNGKTRRHSPRPRHRR